MAGDLLPEFPYIILPEWLYDAAVKAGYDMRWYIRRQPIPKEQ